jgi:A/G-specific adenine glycosylase
VLVSAPPAGSVRVPAGGSRPDVGAHQVLSVSGESDGADAPGPVLDPAGRGVAAFRRGILGLQAVLRPLPWRQTRAPWPVMVSEVMLQQTQASRVVGPWVDFVAQFPDPGTCAAAPTGAVVRAWAGLGYNRRAVRLRAAAAAMVERHASQVPADLHDLLALPGIGPYTARAVLAFAYEQDVAVVDTNVRRVLSRSVLGRRAAPGELQALADALVPPGRGWAWNQGILELGATVCTSRAPRCERCPLERHCQWRSAGRPDPDPAAGTPVQAPFDGSDRQGRGRLVQRLRAGPLAAGTLAAAAGWPDDPERAERVAGMLLADGLAVRDSSGALRLA